jgi:carboxylate-amine ligase
VIDALVDRVAGELERTGDEALVRDGLLRMRERGTGADLQRVAFARAASVEDVLEAMTLAASSVDGGDEHP